MDLPCRHDNRFTGLAVGLAAAASVALTPNCQGARATAKSSNQEDISISHSGEVFLRSGQRVARLAGIPPAPRNIASERIIVAGHDILHVAVEAAPPTGRAVEALIQLDSPTARVVFSDGTGLQGPDAEYSLVLSATPERILLFQRREGWVDCSGKPLTLFPRLYDFETNRFRPAQIRPNAKDELPMLPLSQRIPPQVAADLAQGRPPLNAFRWEVASSQLGDAGRADRLTPPVDVADDNPASAWVEGVGGHGIGQRLIARRSTATYPLAGLLLIPGAGGSRRASDDANRIKSVVLEIAGAQIRRYRVRFSRDPLHSLNTAPYFWIALPEPVAARCVSLAIESVYPGQRAQREGQSAGETAIAEIRLVTLPELSGAIPTLLRDLTGDDHQRRRQAQYILRKQGPHLLDELRRLARTTNTTVRASVAALLVQLRRPETAGLLTSLLPTLPAGPRALALDELARIGPTSAHHVRALLPKAPAELRPALVGLLGRVGGSDAWSALVALAGHGARTLRSATVRALARISHQVPAACEQIVDAAHKASSPLTRADMVAAAELSCTHIIPDHKDAVAQRLAALWRSSAPFELRFRLVQALGRIAPDAYLNSILAEAVAGDPPPLRRAAVRRIGEARPSRRRHALLRAALSDSDPAVRQVAVEALANASSPPAAVENELLSRLESERWGMVIRAIAATLARRCSPRAITALTRLLRHGDASVGNAAANALGQCAPEALFDATLELTHDTRLSADRRAHALGAVPESIAKTKGEQLLPLLSELRGSARSDADLHLVGACIRALAASPSTSVTHALASYLSDDPDQTIRASAAEALSRRCGNEAINALQRAATDPSPLVQRIARAGALSCRSLHSEQ